MALQKRAAKAHTAASDSKTSKPFDYYRQSVATARKVIAQYRRRSGCDGEYVISDLLCDCLHLCDLDPRFGHLTWHLSLAFFHFHYHGVAKTLELPAVETAECSAPANHDPVSPLLIPTKEECAKNVRKLVSESRKANDSDRRNAIGNLMCNLIDLCNHEPSLGAFHTHLHWALFRYYQET